jgi:hypothetical protein
MNESLNYRRKAVQIHGLGAVIPKAIRLALMVQERIPEKVILNTFTATVECVDDLIDEDDDLKDLETQKRFASAIRIEVVVSK